MNTADLLKSRYHQFLYLLKYPAWVLTGNEKYSGGPISVAFAGFGTTKNYLLKTIFEGDVREHSLGTRWGYQIEARRGPIQECSLLFCEVPLSKEKYFPPHCDFWMPAWLEMEVDLTESLPSLLKRKRYACIRKKTEQQELSYQIRSDEESFEDFYHNMYLPHIRTRHDTAAIMMGYEALKKHFFNKNTELLLVMKDGQSIAGCVIDFSGKAQLQHMGMRDASVENMRSGFSDACIFFSILRVKERACARLSLGHCRPFFNDGGFRYKARYGSYINSHHKDSGRIGVTVLRSAPEVSSYFMNNPFVTLEEDHYTVHCFKDSAPKTEWDPFVTRCRSGKVDVRMYPTEKILQEALVD